MTNGQSEKAILPWLFCLSPLVLLLLTWSSTGDLAVWQLFLRSLSFPILVAELLVIAKAVVSGRFAKMLAPLSVPSVGIPLALLFAISIADAQLVSPASAYATFRTYQWGVHLFFGLAIFAMMDDLFPISTFIDATIAASLAIAISLMVFVADVGNGDVNWRAVWPMATHIRHLGFYFTAAGLICFTAICAERGWSAKRIWATVALFLILSLSFWTGSRGALLAIVIGIVGALAFLPSMRTKASLLFLPVFLLAAGASALVDVPEDYMGVVRTVEASAGSENYSLTTGRDKLWAANIAAIKERPVFGYGDGQMTAVAPYLGTTSQPHQVVLQILLAWGGGGLALLAVLAFKIVRSALASARNAEVEFAAPFSILVAYGAFAMYDGALYHSLPVAIFACCLGLVLGGNSHENASQGP